MMLERLSAEFTKISEVTRRESCSAPESLHAPKKNKQQQGWDCGQTGGHERRGVGAKEPMGGCECFDRNPGESLQELAEQSVGRRQHGVLGGGVAETRQTRHVGH